MLSGSFLVGNNVFDTDIILLYYMRQESGNFDSSSLAYHDHKEIPSKIHLLSIMFARESGYVLQLRPNQR
jgi:hypothetical protein